MYLTFQGPCGASNAGPGFLCFRMWSFAGFKGLDRVDIVLACGQRGDKIWCSDGIKLELLLCAREGLGYGFGFTVLGSCSLGCRV